VPYALGLPAYVATEVITRGLIALRDTRTPLVSNSLQLAGRALVMSLLITAFGVRTIPIAFALLAGLEAIGLGAALVVRLQGQIRADVSAPAFAAGG